MSVRENPFEEGGQEYAAYRPSYPFALVDGLAEACERLDVALDVGCGSGQFSLLRCSSIVNYEV